MKKYLFIAMAAVAMTFTSCKNEPAPQPAPGEGEEIEAEVVEYSPADSLKAAFDANDSGKFNEFLTQAKAKIDELKDTDPATAKKYLEAVQTFLKEQGDAITKFVGGNTAVATLVKEVSEFKLPDVPGEVKDAVDGAVEQGKEAVGDAVEKGKEAVEGAKDQVEGAVEKGKEAVGDAVEKGKEKVDGAVDKAKDKAAEGVDKAADAVKGALGK